MVTYSFSCFFFLISLFYFYFHFCTNDNSNSHNNKYILPYCTYIHSVHTLSLSIYKYICFSILLSTIYTYGKQWKLSQYWNEYIYLLLFHLYACIISECIFFFFFFNKGHFRRWMLNKSGNKLRTKIKKIKKHKNFIYNYLARKKKKTQGTDRERSQEAINKIR